LIANEAFSLKAINPEASCLIANWSELQIAIKALEKT
jgi:hypothetical protein